MVLCIDMYTIYIYVKVEAIAGASRLKIVYICSIFLCINTYIFDTETWDIIENLYIHTQIDTDRYPLYLVNAH